MRAALITCPLFCEGRAKAADSARVAPVPPGEPGRHEHLLARPHPPKGQTEIVTKYYLKTFDHFSRSFLNWIFLKKDLAILTLG